MLSEKEIENLIRVAYEENWPWVDPVPGAVHAIAERLAGDVVWEGRGKLWDRGTGWYQLVNDRARHIGGFFSSEDLEDGQRVRVYVVKEKENET